MKKATKKSKKAKKAKKPKEVLKRGLVKKGKAVKKVKSKKKVIKRAAKKQMSKKGVAKKGVVKKRKPKKKIKPKKKVAQRKKTVLKKIKPKKKPVKSRPATKSRGRGSSMPRRKAKTSGKVKAKKIARRLRLTKRKPVKKIRPKKKPRKRVVRKVKPKRKIVRRKKAIKRRKVVRKKPRKRVRAKKKIKKRVVRKVKPRKRKKKSRPQKGRGPSIRRRRKSGPAKPRVYVGKGILDQLFESQAKVKLLRFFFRNAESMFQPKEIFKQLRSNIALLRQEMKKLEKLGLIKQRRAWLTFEKKRGGIRKERKTVWYLNSSFDFFNELRNLVLKSAIASKSDLVEKAKKIGNIKLFVLTGVFMGDDKARADLLIVGDKINQRKLSAFIKDLEAEVGKEINCAVMTSKEFDYRYDMYDRFVRDLLDGKCEVLIKRLDLW